MRTIEKDPDALLDYGFDWSGWLVPGDSVSSASWAVTGSDNAVTLADPDVSGSKCTVWASGGTVGRTYVLRCRVVTANGRTDDRSMTLRIVQR